MPVKNKGKKLQTGESLRSDGRYCYRYTNAKGERRSVYAGTLDELRKKEQQITQDIRDGITTSIKTINDMFAVFLATRTLKPQCKAEYKRLWNRYVKDKIGNIPVCDVKVSSIRTLYSDMANRGLSRGTIHCVHCLVEPTLEIAVDDDYIRTNPAKKAFIGQGREPQIKQALSKEQQERLFSFVNSNGAYKVRLPLLKFAIGTGCRVGEIIGLQWSDIDFESKTITISGQLIYRNIDGSGYKFYDDVPKSVAGFRRIPMTGTVEQALREQKALNNTRGRTCNVKIGNRKDFVFLTASGRPLTPDSVNYFLRNVVNRYNKTFPNDKLPHISAHILRHTCLTNYYRMGLSIKSLQYIAGHENAQTTINIYVHSDVDAIREEMARLSG